MVMNTIREEATILFLSVIGIKIQNKCWWTVPTHIGNAIERNVFGINIIPRFLALIEMNT